MGADRHNLWDGSGDNYIDGEGIGMIKPVEAGCLALVCPVRVFNEQNKLIGDKPAHTVRVIDKYKGSNKTCKKCGGRESVWQIESALFEHDETFSCACRLTRIDGGDPDEITETDKEKDHAYND